MTQEFKRTEKAALSETASKFQLAEALLADIPHTPGKRGGGVTEALERARQAIIDAGGEKRSVETLQEYRAVAIWVGDYAWVEGMDFSSHAQARKAGMTFEQFAAAPITTAELREQYAPKKSGETVPVEKFDRMAREAATAQKLAEADAAKAARAAKEAEENAQRHADRVARLEEQAKKDRQEKAAAEAYAAEVARQAGGEIQRLANQKLAEQRRVEAERKAAWEAERAERIVAAQAEAKANSANAAARAVEDAMTAALRAVALAQSAALRHLESPTGRKANLLLQDSLVREIQGNNAVLMAWFNLTPDVDLNSDAVRATLES